MHLRAFFGTTLFPAITVALALLATVILTVLLSSDVFAQSNSAPVFTEGATAIRAVDEYTGRSLRSDKPWYGNIGDQIAATDTDNDDDKLVYSIKNSRDSIFYVDRSTGQLQIGSPLDYEEASSHTVKVIVTDPEGGEDEITVTVNVNNVDEAEKVILTWKPASGTGVDFKATVTDPDGITGTPTWQWASRDANRGPFTDISGETSATYVHTASRKFLQATAVYTDAVFGNKTASSYQDTGQPSNIDSSYTFEFDSSSSSSYRCTGGTPDFCINVPRYKNPEDDIYYPASVRYTKAGADDKYPQPSDIRYSLSGTDAESFDLDPETKDLFLSAPHVLETKSNFTISITASDPSGRSDTISVKITPSADTYNPVAHGPTEIIVPENGTWQLATYTAQIYERELNEDIDWLISVNPGGGEGDLFDITDEGVLHFRQPPDWENPALKSPPTRDNEDIVYSFSITVYDTNPRGGKRSGKTFYPVSVRVVNVEEVLEIDGPTRISYPENGTSSIHTYSVTGVEGTVSWSLEGGDSGLFSIDSNGALSFNNSPNYEDPFDSGDAKEHQNDYLLSIVVTDGTSTSKLEPVRVMVTNVNEPPAFPSTETGRRTVAEDVGANEDIGDPFEADDPDGDYLEYSLGGTDALSFVIDQSTGQLKTAATLDFETKPSYSLTVAVTDNRDDEGNSDDTPDDTINVTVTVTGANEAPAFKETGTVTREVVENTAKGQNVGAPVLAEDPESEPIEYTLEGTDAASFTIVSTLGQIKTNIDDLDYETKSSYSVTVKASDGTNSVTLPVTINVTDVNETTTIAGDNGPSHPENSTAEIETYVATDEESDGITWDLSGADASHFEISNAGVLTFATKQNYEQPSDQGGNRAYDVTITAFDGNTTGELQVAVTLTDVNEPPTITGEDTIDYVEGDTAEVENYDATDPESDAVTWSLKEVDDYDNLSIDGQTGVLTFDSPPDYDDPNTDNVYEVTVVAKDSANNEATLDVTINVTPVNDPPVITYNGNTVVQTILFNENGSGAVATFVATDQENDPIEWTKSGEDTALFNLSNAGVLNFIAPPNYEDPKDQGGDNDYAVTVQISDGTNNAEMNVTVAVQNVDESPVVTGDTGPSVVEESTDAFATYKAHHRPQRAPRLPGRILPALTEASSKSPPMASCPSRPHPISKLLEAPTAIMTTR